VRCNSSAVGYLDKKKSHRALLLQESSQFLCA
jgi:hypothetical protein